jgi:hypothetical protein
MSLGISHYADVGEKVFDDFEIKIHIDALKPDQILSISLSELRRLLRFQLTQFFISPSRPSLHEIPRARRPQVRARERVGNERRSAYARANVSVCGCGHAV